MTDFWRSFSVTDVGVKRKVNQDAIYVSDVDKIWLVADGMGGHAQGDKASQALVAAFNNLKLSNTLAERVLQIEATISKVNSDLQHYSQVTLNGKAIGSTIVLYTVCQGVGVLLWAGDSRGYKVEKNHVEQISWDHSHIEELLKAGQITKTEAAESKLSNVITRAVGAHKEIYFDHVLIPANISNSLLLCSDGLTNELNDAEINSILQQDQCSQAAIDNLLQKTLEKGAKDNVSIIIIKNESYESQTSESSRLYNQLNDAISRISQDFFQEKIEQSEYMSELTSILNASTFDNNLQTQPGISKKQQACLNNEKELPTNNYPKITQSDVIKSSMTKFKVLLIVVLLIIVITYLFDLI
ncbi:hypothetical protein NBRC116592_25340 [Colwellia sp. KU-HH00111]|uniref:PP2C family protein-serine/threonine phosphatase n=1 Tax=Colwellia sp. KU-HH00111 TaxID=3127652 RepID=UPI00310943BC